MKKIYLFCSAGMSTSLLANKMQECANEHKIPVEVKAFPHSDMDQIVREKNPDCILLGPQVKYALEESQRLYGGNGTPVAVIDQMDYGMMKAEKVLKMALFLIKNGK